MSIGKKDRELEVKALQGDMVEIRALVRKATQSMKHKVGWKGSGAGRVEGGVLVWLVGVEDPTFNKVKDLLHRYGFEVVGK